MEKYRLVRYEWPPASVKIFEGDESTRFVTTKATLEISNKEGSFTVKDAAGKKVTSGTPMADNRWGTFGVSFNLTKNERLDGLGDVNRDVIQRRGMATQIWAAYGPAYAPSPFIMSTQNYGLFVNTTWRHYYPRGQNSPPKQLTG